MNKSYYKRRTRRKRYNQSNGGGLTLVILVFVIALFVYSLSKGESVSSLTGSAKNLFKAKTNNVEIKKIPQSDQMILPTSMPCSQANIAKVLAYTLIPEAIPKDELESIWYKKYYGLLEKDKRYNFFKEENAMKPVTYTDISAILESVLGEGYGVRIQTDDANKANVVSIKEFLNIYEQALMQTGKGRGLEYKEMVIVDTPATNTTLAAWMAQSNQGQYGFQGLVMEPYKNSTIRVAVKNNEILGVTDWISKEGNLKQCYVIKVDQDKAIVRVGETEVTYTNKILSKKDEGTVCEIVIDNQTIIKAQTVVEKNTDRILRVTDKTIYFEKAGQMPYDSVTVLDSDEKSKWKSLSQIPSGAEVEYLCADNKVESIKIINKTPTNTIRVVISTDSFGNYNHDNIQLISVDEYDVIYNGGKQVLAKEKSWDADKFSWEKNQPTIRFVPKKESTLKVLSIKRQGVNPKYKGSLEVTKEENGEYTLVNELSLEDYVAGVIPSEMPTSFGIEATKVQAVAARSYAKIHQQTTNYVKYGAQLDDTTATQVYNNVTPDEIAYRAAKETAGEVLLNNNQVISGNFFSTSCGYTANYGEVWASGEIFPTNTPVYLVSRQQYVGDSVVSSFNNEKEALAFFKAGKDKLEAFDAASPWFRWQLKLSQTELKDIIDYGTAKLSKESPNVFKVLTANGKWESKEITTLGNIKDITVKKRGEGGNIMELVIKGDKHTAKVITEYAIRNVLAPVQRGKAHEPIALKRMDGSEIENMAMLPSAFFSPEIVKDSKGILKNLTLYGGGFGHGVGMSQEGVKGMIDRGYTYREILLHYYPSVIVGAVK